MSLVRAALASERRTASLGNLIDQARGGRTWAGPAVNDESALRLGAVWQCVNFLADLISTLPLDAYRKTGTVRAEVSPTPQIISAPAVSVDRVGFLRQLMTSLLMNGNAYGQVQAVNALGYPTQIELIAPTSVSHFREGATGNQFVRVNGVRHDLWPLGDVWHVAAFQFAGSPVGLSPIGYARQTIGMGLAADEHGARWFGDGAHPTMVVKGKKPIDQATAQIIKQRIMDSVKGREPLAIGDDLDVSPWQMSLADSQFLDAIKANRQTIHGYFFPHLLMSEDTSMTYANVEQRSLDLLTYSVQPWLVRLEEALTALLPKPQYVKFNADAIVRVDAATRYRMHDVAIRGGWRSRNRVRELEDEPPIEGGDEHLWPPYRAFPLESDQQ